jgi:hypothetical protein
VHLVLSRSSQIARKRSWQSWSEAAAPAASHTRTVTAVSAAAVTVVLLYVCTLCWTRYCAVVGQIAAAEAGRPRLCWHKNWSPCSSLRRCLCMWPTFPKTAQQLACVQRGWLRLRCCVCVCVLCEQQLPTGSGDAAHCLHALCVQRRS